MVNLEQARKNIPAIIKKGLKDKGMSQKDLANAVGCDKTAISHYLNGNRVPNVDILISICDVLDIDLNSFKNAQFARATDIDSISINNRDVLYAIAILIKSNNLLYDDRNGDWVFRCEYKATNEFAQEFLKYFGSKYAKKDEILLDLIDDFTKELDKEQFEKELEAYGLDDSEQLPF